MTLIDRFFMLPSMLLFYRNLRDSPFATDRLRVAMQLQSAPRSGRVGHERNHRMGRLLLTLPTEVSGNTVCVAWVSNNAMRQP
jgi:hypothetical protein